MSPKSDVPTSSLPAGLPLPDRIHTFDISYRIVRPEDFGSLGIDPQDIPVGTYVAEDHPPFLASRFGTATHSAARSLLLCGCKDGRT